MNKLAKCLLVSWARRFFKPGTFEVGSFCHIASFDICNTKSLRVPDSEKPVVPNFLNRGSLFSFPLCLYLALDFDSLISSDWTWMTIRIDAIVSIVIFRALSFSFHLSRRSSQRIRISCVTRFSVFGEEIKSAGGPNVSNL